MGYPTYAQQPEPRTRPRSVTISSYLLYAVAGAQLATAVLLLTVIGTMTDVYRDAYAGTSEEGLESLILGGNIVTVVITVLLSVGLVLLALFNNRGRNGSRITTWVIGGLSLCCGGLGVAGSALTSSMNLEGSGGTGPSATEVEQRLSDALPSWYNPISLTLSVIALVAMLAALILLALPASNAFFRKPQGHFDPSIPYPAFQGEPPYPGQPQPPYPGQPYPGQPYPGQFPPGGQPYPGQPYSGQPQPGQPYPGQPYPGQPQPGQFQPGQPYPGQPYPGQPQPQPGQVSPEQPAEPSGPSSSAPPAGSTPPESEQPSGSTPAAAPPEQPSAEDQAPHTGSVPPTDPWSAPQPDDRPDRPPTDPTAQA